MNKDLFKKVSYGMYAVTTKNQNKNIGCIINTFTQITSENALISISLNKNNYTNKSIKETKKFVVSIISEKTPKSLISTFGFSTSLDTDKFIDFDYTMIEELPVLKENTVGYFLCEVQKIIDCNTHDIITARVVSIEKYNDYKPMTYDYYKENLRGFSPKNAPTYIEKEIVEKEEYICSICGYVHEGELPEDYVCPMCGVDKSLFKKRD